MPIELTVWEMMRMVSSEEFLTILDIKDEFDDPEGFEYKEVSEISEVTQESYPEGYVVT